MKKPVPVSFDRKTNILDIGGNQINMNLCGWALHMSLSFYTLMDSKLLVMSTERPKNITYRGGGLSRHFTIFKPDGTLVIPKSSGMIIRQIRDIEHGFGFQVHHYDETGQNRYDTNLWECDFANMPSIDFQDRGKFPITPLVQPQDTVIHFKPLFLDGKDNYNNCAILWGLKTNAQFDDMKKQLCERVLDFPGRYAGVLCKCRAMNSEFETACRIYAAKLTR